MAASRILFACVLVTVITEGIAQTKCTTPPKVPHTINTDSTGCGCDDDCYSHLHVRCLKPPRSKTPEGYCGCEKGYSRYPKLDPHRPHPQECIPSQKPAIPHGGVCTQRLTCLPEFVCSVDNWLAHGPAGVCICDKDNKDKRFHNEDEEKCQKEEPRNHGQGCINGNYLCYKTRNLTCGSDGKCACEPTTLHWNARERRCDTGLYGKTCNADTDCDTPPPATTTSFLKCINTKCACDFSPAPSQWNEPLQKCEGALGDTCTAAGGGSECSSNLTLTCIPSATGDQCGCQDPNRYWHNVLKQCLDKEYGYHAPACTSPGNTTHPGCYLGFDCSQRLSRCECTTNSYWHPGLAVPKCLDMSYGINDPCTSNTQGEEGSCYPGLTCDTSSRTCVCPPATQHYHDVEMKCLDTTHGQGDPCANAKPGCYSTLTCNSETSKCECTNPGQFYHNQKYECFDNRYASGDACDSTDRKSCYLTLECKQGTMVCECPGALPHWHDVKMECLATSHSHNDPCDATNTCYLTLSCVNGKCACTGDTPSWNNKIKKCTATKKRAGAENLKAFGWPIFLGILMTVFNTFGTMILNGFQK